MRDRLQLFFRNGMCSILNLLRKTCSWHQCVLQLTVQCLCQLAKGCQRDDIRSFRCFQLAHPCMRNTKPPGKGRCRHSQSLTNSTNPAGFGSWAQLRRLPSAEQSIHLLELKITKLLVHGTYEFRLTELILTYGFHLRNHNGTHEFIYFNINETYEFQISLWNELSESKGTPPL